MIEMVNDDEQIDEQRTTTGTAADRHRRGFSGWLRGWLTHVPQVPLWQYLGVLVFVGVGFGVVYKQIDDNNDRDLRREVAASEQRAYAIAFDTWAQSARSYDSCVTAVNRSFGGRAWNLWLLDTFEARGAPPDLIAEGHEVLDRELPVRSLDECEDPGPPPVAPATG